MEQTDFFKVAFQDRLNERRVKGIIGEFQAVKGRPTSEQLNEVEQMRLKERETVRGLPTENQLKEMEELKKSGIKGLPK